MMRLKVGRKEDMLRQRQQKKTKDVMNPKLQVIGFLAG